MLGRVSKRSGASKDDAAGDVRRVKAGGPIGSVRRTSVLRALFMMLGAILLASVAAVALVLAVHYAAETVAKHTGSYQPARDSHNRSSPSVAPRRFGNVEGMAAFSGGTWSHLEESAPAATLAFANTSAHEELGIAYLIQSSRAGVEQLRQIKRLINLLLYDSIEKPRDAHAGNNNIVCFHLDRKAPPQEHEQVATELAPDLYPQVHLLHPTTVAYKGISMVDVTLRGLSALLMLSDKWKYFINLSSSDYPLVPQQHLKWYLGSLGFEATFIEVSDGGFGSRQVVLDPTLWDSTDAELRETNQDRPMTKHFSVCKGSAWMILGRSFASYLISGGWDGLPRTMLMYFTNYPRPAEQYFQTVAAHSVYSDSIIPDDMRFIWWPQIGGRGAQHPADLTKEYLQPLSESGAFFARKFKTSPAGLWMTSWIDTHLLRDGQGNATYAKLVLDKLQNRILQPSDSPSAEVKWQNSCHKPFKRVHDPVIHQSYGDGRTKGHKLVSQRRFPELRTPPLDLARRPRGQEPQEVHAGWDKLRMVFTADAGAEAASGAAAVNSAGMSFAALDSWAAFRARQQP